MTHDRAIELATVFIKTTGKEWTCFVVFSEMATSAGQKPDLMGFRSGPSVLIECKVSRSDFLKDRKKFQRLNPEMGMGNYRFYACPDELIKPDELPGKWGLVYLYEDDPIIWRLIKKAEPQHANKGYEVLYMYSALRRIKETGKCKYMIHDP